MDTDVLRTCAPSARPARTLPPPARSLSSRPSASIQRPSSSPTCSRRPGLVPPDKLALVRGRAGQGGSLAQAIVDEGVASREGIARTLAVRHQMPLVDLAADRRVAGRGEQIPLHVLERVVAIPYALEDDALRIAIADPGNLHGIDELRLATRYPARARRRLARGHPRRDPPARRAPRRRSAHELRSTRSSARGEEDGRRRPRGRRRHLRRAARAARQLDHLPGGRGRRLATSTSSRRRTRSSSASASTACSTRCSASRSGWRPGVTTRLKVLAKLDIAERRKPQDGRISLNAAAAGRMLDIRVATLPTVEGEKVVMRLLDKSKQRADARGARALRRRCGRRFAEIISQADRRAPRHRADRLRQVDDAVRGARRRSTGPRSTSSRSRTRSSTGSPGVNQVQINVARRADVRDRAALDPALRPRRRHGRRDPRRRDGEDRDRGRAHRPPRALDAAHERRARRAHAPERDGRRAVPHRRRPSRRCSRSGSRASSARTAARCTTPSVGRAARRRASRPTSPRPPTGWPSTASAAAPAAARPATRAAIGVFQLLTMNETIEQLAVAEGEPRGDRARRDGGGMRSLWDDGIAKVAAGLTSIEELARVLV